MNRRKATTASQQGRDVKSSKRFGIAKWMGSPRQVINKRRRTREGPEPACVNTFLEGGTAGEEG